MAIEISSCKMQVNDRLRKLKLPTLVYRRIRGDMINTYKILNGPCSRQSAPRLNLRKETPHHQELRGHNITLVKPRCNKLMRKHSFPLRIITVWNSLSDNVVNAARHGQV